MAIKIPTSKVWTNLFYTIKIHSTTSPQICDQWRTIILVNTVRDLGIFLTSDLKWSAQVTNIYNKAIRLVYNVLRSFKSNHLNLYTLIFKTYIRPIIEYNSGIWSPYLITEIRKIESIQKTYTRLVCKKLNISYNN